VVWVHDSRGQAKYGVEKIRAKKVPEWVVGKKEHGKKRPPRMFNIQEEAAHQSVGQVSKLSKGRADFLVEA